MSITVKQRLALQRICLYGPLEARNGNERHTFKSLVDRGLAEMFNGRYSATDAGWTLRDAPGAAGKMMQA